MRDRAAGGRAAVESGGRPRQEIQRTTFTDRPGTEPRVEKGPRANTGTDTTRRHQQNDAGASAHRARESTTSVPSATAAPALRDRPNGPVRQASIPTPPPPHDPAAAIDPQRAARPPTPTCRPRPADAPDPSTRTTDAQPLPRGTANDPPRPTDASEPDDPSLRAVPHLDDTCIGDARRPLKTDAGITGTQVAQARGGSGTPTFGHLDAPAALPPHVPGGLPRLSPDGVPRQQSRKRETPILAYPRVAALPARPRLPSRQDTSIALNPALLATLNGLLDQADLIRGEVRRSGDEVEVTSQTLRGQPKETKGCVKGTRIKGDLPGLPWTHAATPTLRHTPRQVMPHRNHNRPIPEAEVVGEASSHTMAAIMDHHRMVIRLTSRRITRITHHRNRHTTNNHLIVDRRKGTQASHQLHTVEAMAATVGTTIIQPTAATRLLLHPHHTLNLLPPLDAAVATTAIYHGLQPLAVAVEEHPLINIAAFSRQWLA